MAQETARCDMQTLFKASACSACVLAVSFLIVHVFSIRIRPARKTNYRNVCMCV